MWRFFYTSLMYLIQPLVLLFMWLRGFKAPNYRKRLGERYGFYASLTPPKAGGIVIHSASVGEVIAATPLVQKLQKNYPHFLLLSLRSPLRGLIVSKRLLAIAFSIAICLTTYLVLLIVLLTLFSQNFVL